MPPIHGPSSAGPLRSREIAPGARCPVTPVTIAKGWRAQGSGPVYPVGAHPALHFNYPPLPTQIWHGSKWGGQKVLWIARPSYRGRVLIRGRQLDGGHGIRFGRGLQPTRDDALCAAIRGADGESDWYNQPSFTRLNAPGCYAWQVDGASFSHVIVFRAVLAAT